MLEEAKRGFVDMVLEHERGIAGYFWGLGSEWKWELLEGQVAELVTREPVWGVEVLRRWGVDGRDLGGNAA
jgi:hypothetical protein